LAVFAVLSVAACQPLTFDFPEDDASVDAAASPALDGQSEARTVFEAGTRNTSWTPPDGCAGDTACLTCQTDIDCPDGWRCNPDNGHCSTCRGPFDCPSGLVCQYNQCLTPCENDAWCQRGHFPEKCNMDRVCVACTSDGDCRPPQQHCTATGACAGCASNADCANNPNGFVFCGALGMCGNCASNADCDGGATCEPLHAVCTFDFPSTDF
jgi:hypothetical protein